MLGDQKRYVAPEEIAVEPGLAFLERNALGEIDAVPNAAAGGAAEFGTQTFMMPTLMR